ncbi:MAG: DUF2914 domain-containing protein [Deltaproteobacteria bacterium]|nr:DUF2914 domain-containing protein [Deltaproteobacteria bacterium]MBW2212154.1 DUF2914 domain-containing protein [Deltaproteobacteria bacterium]MBW2214925.1 DUF2914 domain-containing protein [Deltaproteobacteria bacterium]MBW2380390.1 DUF2914 domain-containing protein [Deltaproteobacteria bacterium]MBW2551051.1 DUF2914 domain-containing protein [Deltaproteobacteria bacterium]
MKIKSRVITPIMLVLLTAVGCNEATPSTSDVIERATSPKPTLTSTAPPTAPKPVEAKQAEPSILEAEKLPVVETERSFAPELESMDGLTIRRLVTASEIEHREPVAASSVFGRHEERVYAFLEVSNESEDDMTLLVHFIGPGEQVSGGIELNIPPAVPRWRTWALTRHAKQAGLWRVEVRSPDGDLLGALPFEVEADH